MNFLINKTFLLFLLYKKCVNHHFSKKDAFQTLDHLEKIDLLNSADVIR